MTAVEHTRDYEHWLRAALRPLELLPADLAHKHRLMADPRDPFPFFRGTYYLWAKRWAEHAGRLDVVPHVLSVGDLHLENFGTWRDVDGRLCWGVNDFDEADEVPFTLDLVRLAASVRFAGPGGAVRVKLSAACGHVLAGYRDTLATPGGTPFVLEENHRHLRAVAMADDRAPRAFWDAQRPLLALPPADPPADARAAVVAMLPPDVRTPDYRVRAGAGVGSLGRPRYAAFTDWAGGLICREAKAAAPPATAWAWGTDHPNRAAAAVSRAKRSPDPYYHPAERWVTRRLAPRSQRIHLDQLPKGSLRRVLRAMGSEVANVHLGTPDAAESIPPHLDSLPADWLPAAARRFAKLLTADWHDWRHRHRTAAPLPVSVWGRKV